MRIILYLLPLILGGCGDSTTESHNGLSTEWLENDSGSRSALLIRRDGVVIVEIGAVSNAFFVETKGSDGITDLNVSYYGEPGADAPTPEVVERIVREADGEIAKIVFYGPDGMIEKISTGETDVIGAQQNAAGQPATRSPSK